MNYPYVLFGSNEKPKGGAMDYLSAWGSMDEVKAEVLRLGLKWWQVATIDRNSKLSVIMVGPEKKSATKE